MAVVDVISSRFDIRKIAASPSDRVRALIHHSPTQVMMDIASIGGSLRMQPSHSISRMHIPLKSIVLS